VVPVGLIPAIKPGGGGTKPVVVVGAPVVGVVLVPGGVVLVPGGVVLVLLVVPVPAWLGLAGKTQLAEATVGAVELGEAVPAKSQLPCP